MKKLFVMAAAFLTFWYFGIGVISLCDAGIKAAYLRVNGLTCPT
ncbi:MAG: hypothetical protein ACUZ8O_09440 [Candidatus Anammoxibacter sp.]